MASRYDPGWLAEFYDDYGDKEWHRWEKSPAQEVKFHIHRHLIREYVKEGDRVLEVGAGPGRFTRVLAEAGMRSGCDRRKVVSTRSLSDLRHAARLPAFRADHTVARPVRQPGTLYTATTCLKRISHPVAVGKELDSNITFSFLSASPGDRTSCTRDHTVRRKLRPCSIPGMPRYRFWPCFEIGLQP